MTTLKNTAIAFVASIAAVAGAASAQDNEQSAAYNDAQLQEFTVALQIQVADRMAQPTPAMEARFARLEAENAFGFDAAVPASDDDLFAATNDEPIRVSFVFEK